MVGSGDAPCPPYFERLALRSGASPFCVVVLEVLRSMGMKFGVHLITKVGMVDPRIHV